MAKNCVVMARPLSPYQPQFVFTGLDGAVTRQQRTAAGRTAVGDIDKLQSCKAEFLHHRIRVAGILTAAKGELHVRPITGCVTKRLTYRDDSLLSTRHTGRAAERMNADTNDRYLSHL
jgi:hypothetical protein